MPKLQNYQRINFSYHQRYPILVICIIYFQHVLCGCAREGDGCPGHRLGNHVEALNRTYHPVDEHQPQARLDMSETCPERKAEHGEDAAPVMDCEHGTTFSHMEPHLTSADLCERCEADTDCTNAWRGNSQFVY